MSHAKAEAAASPQRRIVLVVGPGRSGTSTMAGVLTMLGLEVPGKMIAGNATNPRGFFEPRWVVNLHKQVLRRSVVSTLDASPDAGAVVDGVSEELGVADTLLAWVGERLESQPRLVVKDPRLIWFTETWAVTSEKLGIVPDFVVMLRHPAEVIGSRQTYYARGEKPPGRVDNVAQLAGWINVALQSELITRRGRRVFVHYPSLTAGWRYVMRRVEETLDLGLEVPGDGTAHPVDEFIDPSLRRVQKGWDEVEVPAGLRELADRLWQLLLEIADEGDSPERLARADALRDEYAQLAADAAAMSRRLLKRAAADGVRRGRALERKALAKRAATHGTPREAGGPVHTGPVHTGPAAPAPGVPARVRHLGGRVVRRLRRLR